MNSSHREYILLDKITPILYLMANKKLLSRIENLIPHVSPLSLGGAAHGETDDRAVHSSGSCPGGYH